MPSALSNTSSTEAWPTGFREPEPLKMTSAIESPRRCLAEISPITQRTASMMFDLPHPFGPTTPTRLLGNDTEVGSIKDLNPASLILVRRIGHQAMRGLQGSAECKRIRRSSALRSGHTAAGGARFDVPLHRPQRAPLRRVTPREIAAGPGAADLYNPAPFKDPGVSR